MADYGYYIGGSSEQLHVSIGDTARADVSLPRIRPYWGCKFSLGDIHDVRMNYLYRDTGPPLSADGS
jgi:hypothetical protein